MYQIRETLVMEQKQMRQNMITIARAPFFFLHFLLKTRTQDTSALLLSFCKVAGLEAFQA